MTARNGMGTSRPAFGGRWQDVLDQAQQRLAQAVLAAVAAGRLDRNAYQAWLAIESALCQVDQRALLAIADWHRPQPALHAAALEWAAETGAHAERAATDLRALDGIAAAPAPQVEAWRRFVDTASGSTRAGETLGAVALHAGLLQGAARSAVAIAGALPFAAGTADSHLLSRSLVPAGLAREARESLLQAYSATALAVGAQRAASWHCTALAAAFTTKGDTP